MLAVYKDAVNGAAVPPGIGLRTFQPPPLKIYYYSLKYIPLYNFVCFELSWFCLSESFKLLVFPCVAVCLVKIC